MNVRNIISKLLLSAIIIVPQMGYSKGLNYVGVDIVQSYMKFHNDFGGNIFAKSAPGINLFVGHMFNENFGFEIGYEVEKKKQRHATILAGNTVAGNTINLLDEFESYYTTLKKKQPYFGFIAKMPVTDTNFLQLLLGYSLVKVTAKSLLTANGDSPDNFFKSYIKTKAVPMVRVAFEHKYTNNFSIKTFLSWRNTNQIKIFSQEISNLTYQLKSKDSMNIGAGLVYYI